MVGTFYVSYQRTSDQQKAGWKSSVSVQRCLREPEVPGRALALMIGVDVVCVRMTTGKGGSGGGWREWRDVRCPGK